MVTLLGNSDDDMAMIPTKQLHRLQLHKPTLLLPTLRQYFLLRTNMVLRNFVDYRALNALTVKGWFLVSTND